MSDSNQHNPNADLPLAALIRLAADGEISAEQERRLEIEIERDPDVARRVEAEERLRSSIARAFESGPATPAGLRDRVAAAMASADLGVAEMDEASQRDDVPTRMASVTRDRSFWAGPAARVLAAAAALTLVATVFVVSRGPSADPTLGSRTRAVQFVAGEHGRCVSDLAPGSGKFRVTNASEMPGLTGDVLGQEIKIADLVLNGVENVRFIDAGRCGVPGGGSSMHVRFEAPSGTGEGTAQFSLFVQQNSGSMELAEGITYELDPTNGGEIDLKSPSIFVWLRGELVYYLVVDCPKSCKPIREHLAAPESIESLTNAA